MQELILFNWDGIYKVMAFGTGLRIPPTKSQMKCHPLQEFFHDSLPKSEFRGHS